MCVLKDTHGQPQTTCVCWRTNTDVLCVLTDTHIRPVCADEHKWTHTDTHGQPQMSYSPRGPKSPKQSTGRASVLSPKTNVAICVLMDSHGTSCVGCKIQTDTHGHTQTATDVLCVLNRQPTWAKITRTVHGKGLRAESKDQRADMSTDGQPQTSCVC
ncbi:unnamed protein product [Brassica rapa]|uniref:Uncharacterized protein n=1 Tax=Brassica campestris TaxID=3711 RepID=A0A8D9DHZ3_BRACM|nr:unnamed protein product [Brassica rapa]